MTPILPVTGGTGFFELVVCPFPGQMIRFSFLCGSAHEPHSLMSEGSGTSRQPGKKKKDENRNISGFGNNIIQM